MGQNTQEEARAPGASALAVVTDRQREYSEAERTAIVLLATLVGVAEAARQRDVPASTIYTWLAKIGGAEALREAASDTLASTEYAVAIDVCLEIRKRLPDMSDKGLVDALRVLAASGARSPGDDHDDTRPPPQVFVQFNNNGRGGYDTIPIPADIK